MTITLKEYYNKLQNEEKVVSPIDLIHKWNDEDINNIVEAFKCAIKDKLIFTTECKSAKISRSNQSAGNKFAIHFVKMINDKLKAENFSIENCHGNGYPDKILKSLTNTKIFPLEIKATSNWDSNDSNRRVLTCSSEKLTTVFKSSQTINHILVTIIYSNSPWCINALRLDFIEPDSQVNVRLEASTSHKLLDNGSHYKILLS